LGPALAAVPKIEAFLADAKKIKSAIEPAAGPARQT
jgi:hypothetical protein